MAPVPLDPTNATLSEAIALLDNDWRPLVSSVFRAERTLWFGSAISRDRFDDLSKLLNRLLAELHARMTPGDPNCPFRKALGDVVSYSGISVDLDAAPTTWPRLHEIVPILCTRYDEVLGIPLSGMQPDAIIWDVLRLPQMYGDQTVLPDAEHRFIALLVREGVLGEFVSANWDCLIEDAHESCGPGGLRLGVVARPEEMATTQPRLVKIHGCARRAGRDPSNYRASLVATKVHIARWIANSHEAFPDFVRNLIRQRTVLFVGLSAQDDNLQMEFLRTAGPTAPSTAYDRFVFAKPRLEPAQTQLLQLAYGDDAFSTHRAQIEQGSVLPLYAKPLLGTLYVLCLVYKAKLLIDKAQELSVSQRQLATDGLVSMTAAACAHVDRLSSPDRWRSLATEGSWVVARFVALYRDQKIPSDSAYYVALHNRDLRELEADPNLPDGDDRMILLLAALFIGQERGYWTLAVCSGPGSEGHLALASGPVSLRVFVAREMKALAKLDREGFVDPDDDPEVVLLYTRGTQARPRRATHPGRSLPGRALRRPREIALEQFLGDLGPTDDVPLALQNALGV